MNIIIPAAGMGQRFVEDHYQIAKPLINVLGEPMIVHVIRSLKPAEGDEIYIVYHQELDEYFFSNILHKYFYDLDLHFIKLDHRTSGPAETVLEALLQMDDIDLGIIVLDCDTLYRTDILQAAKSEAGDCVFYFIDESETALFSYIKIQADKVIEIREKVRISNYACAGAYAFQSGKILKKYCEALLNSGNGNREPYISMVYALMLQDGISITARQVDTQCLGTPQQLKTFCLENGGAIKKRFCFDLDGTLVTFPDKCGEYGSVEPIYKNIKLARYLHEQGHTIIIQTARNMLSSHHNPGEATRRSHAVIFETLEKYNIPFDEIYFGKPFAHFYIDDLSVKAFDIEREIGFYNTMIETRAFNQIQYGDRYVIKTTSNPGEIHWYHNIPEVMRGNFAEVLDIKGNVIMMEKITGIVFSYLLINHSLHEKDMKDLLETIEKLHHSSGIPAPDIDYRANYNHKLLARAKKFDYTDISRDAGMYLQTIMERLEKHDPIIGVIHGDLVFSNIFLCANRTIRFVDMRGRVGEVDTIFGDVFYDYAKIYQSLYGYDYILNDRQIDGDNLKGLRNYFENYFLEMFSREALENLKYITASLYFSLIPLHNEAYKQKRYFEIIRKILA